jgi:signal transduction histidine kinase
MFVVHNFSYLFLYAFTIILNSYLGFLVFLKNPKNNIHRYFFLFSLSIVGWILTLYLFYGFTIPTVVLILGRLNFVFAILIAYLFYKFTYIFPTSFKIKSKLSQILFFETIILIALTLLTGLIDKNEIIKEADRITVFGPLYSFFLIHFITYVIASAVISIKKFRRYSGIQKVQTLYLYVGVLPALFMGTTTNIILPFFFKFYTLQQIAILFTVWMCALITYAIIRYRFFDIRLAIRRGFIRLVLASFTYAAFYLVSWIFVKSFGSVWVAPALIAGVFIAIVFSIAWPYVEKITVRFCNRYLYATLYERHTTLKKLAQELTTIIDLDKIISLITSTVQKMMGVERIAVILTNLDTDEYELAKGVKFTDKSVKELLKDDILSKYLETSTTSKKSLVLDELSLMGDDKKSAKGDYGSGENQNIDSCFRRNDKEDSKSITIIKVKELLKHTDVSIITPMSIKDEIIGFVALGSKSSGDAYSKEEIELVETLAAQATIAIENARLYNHLEEMVDKQTQEIKKKNIHLGKLLEMRSQFLDTASHQLRTPVSVINGYVSMFLEGDFEESPKEKKDEIYQAIAFKTKKLRQIISDILYSSELDTAEFILGDKELQKIKLIPYLEHIVQGHQDEAGQKELSLILQTDSLTPDEKETLAIYASERYLEVVLDNLIVNSLQYTPEGGKITVKPIPQQDKEIVKIEVQDTGIGIPKEDYEILFDKFRRAKNANSMHTDGSGLGLFIVKNMITAHPKGKVGFKSELGKGSTFWVEVERVRN